MTAADRDYLSGPDGVVEGLPVKLGPNDVQACGTEACRRWHAAHGYLHLCGQMEPHYRRTEPDRFNHKFGVFA